MVFLLFTLLVVHGGNSNCCDGLRWRARRIGMHAKSKEYDVHFWAPTFKWVISLANVADFSKPPENISYPHQIVVACTGLIWSRYSLVITPVGLSPENISYPHQIVVACIGLIWSRYSLVITPRNLNLFCVNIAMSTTGLYQLSRKVRQDYLSEAKEEHVEE